jgi:hypothetical protein
MSEMAVLIQSSAKCEVRSVTRFINAKGECPAVIHEQIVAVYGNTVNWQNVTKWYHESSEGRTDVHDEERSGRPSLMTRFKGQAADFCDSGIQKLVPRLNVWTMPVTMLKNKVMNRQFIRSVAFEN